GRYVVSKGLDADKDQSYVLWGLTQESLKRSIFPMGGFHKKDIRQMALDRGFENLALKSESYEICFIPDNDYRGFLKRRVEGLEERVNGGDFVNMKGEVMGKHQGYPFYTVGQRKGLEIATGTPMYVTRIIPETNTVVLGEVEDLNEQRMVVGKTNFQKWEPWTGKREALTKIRYKDPGTMSTLELVDDEVHVIFHAPVSAIAPGQSAVFYDGDDLIGGGMIRRAVFAEESMV
ncbi:MAG: tRNA 2-thiouridine(34) synthase MnmA, partial [Flavobacteriales bacterium]|nr:tRNA 2-thiouridine(34) synthase MnmA [Flavobacteriales bacterium]